MKAGIINESSDEIEIKDMDIPKLENGEALISVKALGICGSDLKIIHKFLKPPFYPFIIGHEIAGSLIEAKPSNKNEEEIVQKIEGEGGNVIVYFYVGCNICPHCKRGEMNLCYNVKRIGFELNGGLAEFVKAPIINLVPLKSKLTYENAVLADAGATVFRALKKVKIRPGLSAAVMGVGGLGSMAIQLLRLFGCEIVALDKKEEKLKLARELGANYTVNTVEHKDGIDYKVDLFMDFVGNSESQEIAMKMLKKKGNLIQVGYTNSSLSKIAIKDLIYNEIKIMGSIGNSINDLYEVVELASKGFIRAIITNEYKMEEVNKALKDLEENKVRGRSLIRI
jgi:D-arabinose 1-dehydrogenase-like Zn-dependent alcohol dehydrogenase